jgi:hypothetical protein
MCPSQTPEKSGTPSDVLGSDCAAGAFSIFESVFGEVCAHNPDENITAEASASARALLGTRRKNVWRTQYFFIS